MSEVYAYYSRHGASPAVAVAGNFGGPTLAKISYCFVLFARFTSDPTAPLVFVCVFALIKRK